MSEVTQLLNAVAGGDRFAGDQFLPLIYDERCKLAAHKLATEMPGRQNAARLVFQSGQVGRGPIPGAVTRSSRATDRWSPPELVVRPKLRPTQRVTATPGRAPPGVFAFPPHSHRISYFLDAWQNL
ncbi:MAG TPA: ECF-type sigma factor [Urbifossiella sp.]|nr:ECF-type sigma factor [Urbifossiella sp.]